MFQIRIHGRGGQGVVTAAELLSVAAFYDGRSAQAFPSFGSERMGAPVVAFCRIADQAIRSREPVTHPDAVIVQDPTLLHHVDLFAGLSLSGCVILNSSRSPDELGIAELADRLSPGRLVTVPATELARMYTGRPLPNVALLGAFSAATNMVSAASLGRAIRQRFPGRVGETNAAAAEAAYAAARGQDAVAASGPGKDADAQTD